MTATTTAAMATMANENEVKDDALILLGNGAMGIHQQMSFKVCLCTCVHVLGNVGKERGSRQIKDGGRGVFAKGWSRSWYPQSNHFLMNTSSSHYTATGQEDDGDGQTLSRVRFT